ncbi:hypothetical protein X798_03578 [Onchocerca flexuosa]|uniref:Uncharacterized protein n=1 Tax=Onchocerca flexuosa TaxID=387005 RepID=A0A238BVQ3_9BILA|nr:hypothetical protein X798_03578 [Onchocerca flexuosa]
MMETDIRYVTQPLLLHELYLKHCGKRVEAAAEYHRWNTTTNSTPPLMTICLDENKISPIDNRALIFVTEWYLRVPLKGNNEKVTPLSPLSHPITMRYACFSSRPHQ